MNQTGVRSTDWRRSARSKRSFMATHRAYERADGLRTPLLAPAGTVESEAIRRTMRGFDESEFGPNAWLVDELYRQYLADPESVSEAWREYFEDYQPRTGNGQAAPVTTPAPAPPPPEPRPPA